MGKEKYCLVLSGGGAKGVYHIGVRRALKELGIEIEAVVGNSIGAIIAAFLVQGLDKELEDIGSRIGLDYILNVPKELVKEGELHLSNSRRTAFGEFYRTFASRKGLDTSPLRRLLKTHLDEEAIRGSDLDLGVVTYNLSDMKPREIFKEEMEKGEMINYVMASSAFPGFESPEIGGKKYIDGGVYNNIPFAMAKSRGYRNIIVVDISGAGVNRKPDITGTRTVYIKNSRNMGGVMDFNRKFLDEYTELGYLDTMKTFGRLDGLECFIKHDADLELAFSRFLEGEKGRNHLKSLPESTETATPILVHRLFPKKRKYDKCWLPVFADCAARSLGLDHIKLWNYEELFDSLIKARDDVIREAEEMHKRPKREFISTIKGELKERKLLSVPYIYHLAGDYYLPPKLRKSLDKFMIDYMPELASGVFFLNVLEDFMKDIAGDSSEN